jgi:hypothetical protein
MELMNIALSCSRPALLFWGERILGEGGEQPLSLLVGPSGVYYVGVFPLDGAGFYRRIQIDKGRIAGALPRDLRAVEWSESLLEILIEVPDPPAGEAGQLQSLQLQGGAIATLYWEGGLNLAVERGSEVLLALRLGPWGPGELEKIPLPEGELLLARGGGESSTVCCGLHDGREVRTTLMRRCSSFEREGTRAELIEDLPTRRGHQKKELIDLTDGSVLESEIGFFTHPPREAEREEDAALDLLDALQLGLEEEVQGLLGGDLLGLEGSALKEFFGPFEDRAEAPLGCGVVIIGLMSREQVCRPRLIAFEMQREEEGFKVINAQEQ